MRAILTIAACLIGAQAAAFEIDGGGDFATRVVAITEPVPAPETVIDLADGRATLADHHGAVAVVVMWATWCEVCEVEMPIVASLAKDYADRNIRFLPISVDDTPAVDLVTAHLREHGLSALPVMVDRHHGLADQVGLRGTPTTIIIDKFSQVVAAFEGQAPWSDPAMAAYLTALETAESAEASRGVLAE